MKDSNRDAPFSEAFIIKNAKQMSKRGILKQYDDDPWLKNRALNAWEYSRGLLELESYPTDIILPCINVCNANCIMCNLVPKKPQYLDVDAVYERYVTLLPYATQVGIASFGEPLMNPNLGKLAKVIRTECDTRCNIYITSNGLLLENRFELLMETVDNINISLNAATPHTHQRIMGIKNGFEKVISGIKKAVAYTEKDKHSPRINISAVVTRYNMHELADFIRLGNELGVESIYLRALMPEDNSAFGRAREKIRAYDELFPYEEEMFKTHAEEIAATIACSNIKVICTDPVLNPNYTTLTDNFPFDGELTGRCFRPYTTALFFGDTGRTVQPCCFMSGKIPFPKFDHPEAFKDKIWNGQFFSSLRSSFLNGMNWPSCQSCITKI